MKTTIYYFTGTGNSLWLSRLIGEKLDGSELIAIPNAVNRAVTISGEVLGIVTPIYMYNIPHIVVDFIRNIENAGYLFIVFAGAGELGTGIRETLNLLKSRNLALSALFNVPMPSNYTPYGCPDEEKRISLLAKAEDRVDEIVETVSHRGRFIDSTNSSAFETWVHPGILYRLGYKQIHTFDKSFYADEKCNGCSICQKVCPVNNITMSDNRPLWHNRCQQCYACLQWCPQHSIQAGKKTVGIERYHNPHVTVNDIIASSAEYGE